MSHGLDDKGPPHAMMMYSASAFTVAGLLLVVLALLEECLRTLHAILGAGLLVSAVFVLRAAFQAYAAAAHSASAESTTESQHHGDGH